MVSVDQLVELAAGLSLNHSHREMLFRFQHLINDYADLKKLPPKLSRYFLSNRLFAERIIVSQTQLLEIGKDNPADLVTHLNSDTIARAAIISVDFFVQLYFYAKANRHNISYLETIAKAFNKCLHDDFARAISEHVSSYFDVVC